MTDKRVLFRKGENGFRSPPRVNDFDQIIIMRFSARDFSEGNFGNGAMQLRTAFIKFLYPDTLLPRIGGLFLDGDAAG
jgi:hypothetical protein